jgi:hypothetical protein
MAGTVSGFALQYGVAGCAEFNDAAAPKQDLPAANAREYCAQAVKFVMRIGFGKDGWSAIRDIKYRFSRLMMQSDCPWQCGTLAQVQHVGPPQR